LDWEAAGSAVAARRAQLGIKSAQAAADGTNGGCGVTSWREIERGDGASKRAVVLNAVELRLGWAPGSIRAIAESREPVEVSPAESGDVPSNAELAAEVRELRGRMSRTETLLVEILARLDANNRAGRVGQ
jgi:hypothetical protein